MKEINVIVAGGRDFNLYNYRDIMKPTLDKLMKQLALLGYDNVNIISGKANGADRFGEKYATENRLNILEFPANWDKHGKVAGPIRNHEMAINCDMAIVFWDGKSRGSLNMINQAKKENKLVKVIGY